MNPKSFITNPKLRKPQNRVSKLTKEERKALNAAPASTSPKKQDAPTDFPSPRATTEDGTPVEAAFTKLPPIAGVGGVSSSPKPGKKEGERGGQAKKGDGAKGVTENGTVIPPEWGKRSLLAGYEPCPFT